MTAAETLYVDTNPDLPGTHLPSGFRRVSSLGLIKYVILSRAAVLELPEPLWVRFLPKTALAALAWKASRLVRRTPGTTVAYAIENNEPVNLLFGNRHVPQSVAVPLTLLLGLVIRSSVDRLCFGSEGSRATYQSIPLVSGIDHSVVVNLPARPTLVNAPPPDANTRRNRVVFVGVLEPRKGIDVLMKSWPSVEQCCPDAVLTIVGDGPMSREVEQWSAESPRTRDLRGRLPHSQVSSLIGESALLVAPSVRDGRWREQIGLPILEALTVGTTVVASDETALATWLAAKGHSVLGAHELSKDLAGEIVDRLRTPLPIDQVVASLPEVSGRVAADEWLNQDQHSPSDGASDGHRRGGY
ncbi:MULTISPECIES: glycosyltransferase family 4 protein [unclassified Rhodococcus (in: high G+C Gram-positive bacteria)]|uniref:glycosyltransferase family 4 protein n=1 Tax=unclassified Rhodococcus (in: high G+C Gram-positive bacteria) TaxID=192944 RepID=UPI001595D51C|nr:MULTISPECIES: glycosyltransferase [unclassified Rhodococcus (in: high G+C Gram-positive bacteria)]